MWSISWNPLLNTSFAIRLVSLYVFLLVGKVLLRHPSPHLPIPPYLCPSTWLLLPPPCSLAVTCPPWLQLWAHCGLGYRAHGRFSPASPSLAAVVTAALAPALELLPHLLLLFGRAEAGVTMCSIPLASMGPELWKVSGGMGSRGGGSGADEGTRGCGGR